MSQTDKVTIRDKKLRSKKSRRSKNHFLYAIFIAVSLIFGITTFTASETPIPQQASIQSEHSWWNPDFSYRKKIILNPQAENDLIEFKYFNKALTSKVLESGADIALVKVDHGESEEIGFSISAKNELSIILRPFEKLETEKTYFLYYGNRTRTLEPITEEISEKNILNLHNLSNEETPDISISSQRQWHLSNTKVRTILKSTSETIDNIQFFLIDPKTFEKRSLVVNREFENEFNVKLSNVKPGEYRVFATAVANGEVIRSQNIHIKVSEPIYVAWTVAWAGVNPEQKNLNSISKISDQFSAPVTHFWNPRLLINLRITQARKNELVNWLKTRVTQGDEVAMNLHMHHDMVEESGVRPLYDAPTWDNGFSGYDTPATVYNYEEFQKILTWGIDKMKSIGFDNIKGFRAGGWFMNSELLKAVEDTGFLYEASGRITTPIGANKLEQEWNLTNLTQPYFPSIKDINLAYEPSFRIMEIPNNGGDSYRNSFDELLKNFFANYSVDQISEESKLITYLSFPEWFEVDEPKITALLDTLRSYSLEFDRGPVIFTTLSEWYEINSISKK